MTRPNNALKIFEDKKVRTVRDKEQENWHVAIVDVVAALTESPNHKAGKFEVRSSGEIPLIYCIFAKNGRL